MSNLLGVRFSGPLVSYAAGFAADLSRQGYVTSSGVKTQLRLGASLSAWLSGRGLQPSALACPQLVEEFFAYRRELGHANFRTVKALVPLLTYLRGLGVVGVASSVQLTPAEVLLERFRVYLRGERGLAAASAQGYVNAVRGFVVERVIVGEGDLARLSAAEVTAFVVAESPGRSRGWAKMLVTALRSLLTFLHLAGILDRSLVAAVPCVASWRLAGLPKRLERGEVEALLASCDLRTSVGLRDFAILMLLVRLALRAGEVACLVLDDVNWRSGEVLVRGKGDRHERLPLPDDVGSAVVAYLQRGRPSTALDRGVFVRVRAPHHALSSAGVSNVVFSAAQRAGLRGPVRAHRLRHTAATGLLAAGAPLAEIGQLLRHRSQLSTAIYAKVDREALRAVARPWPERVA